jgi:hypothetical protein
MKETCCERIKRDSLTFKVLMKAKLRAWAFDCQQNQSPPVNAGGPYLFRSRAALATAFAFSSAVSRSSELASSDEPECHPNRNTGSADPDLKAAASDARSVSMTPDDERAARPVTTRTAGSPWRFSFCHRNCHPTTWDEEVQAEMQGVTASEKCRLHKVG